MDIKGIKMNREILKEFSGTAGGGGYTYVVDVLTSGTHMYLTIQSNKDVSVNSTINSVDEIESTLGVLNGEHIYAVGGAWGATEGKTSAAPRKINPPLAYISDGRLYFYGDGSYLCYVLSDDLRKITVIGKR